jgi:hypothetical protein
MKYFKNKHLSYETTKLKFSQSMHKYMQICSCIFITNIYGKLLGHMEYTKCELLQADTSTNHNSLQPNRRQSCLKMGATSKTAWWNIGNEKNTFSVCKLSYVYGDNGNTEIEIGGKTHT